VAAAAIRRKERKKKRKKERKKKCSLAAAFFLYLTSWDRQQKDFPSGFLQLSLSLSLSLSFSLSLSIDLCVFRLEQRESLLTPSYQSQRWGSFSHSYLSTASCCCHSPFLPPYILFESDKRETEARLVVDRSCLWLDHTEREKE
jgi:hypothetical protein